MLHYIKVGKALYPDEIPNRVLQESVAKITPAVTEIFKNIVSEYDQEIPQSQTADKPMAPQGRATQQ